MNKLELEKIYKNPASLYLACALILSIVFYIYRYCIGKAVIISTVLFGLFCALGYSLFINILFKFNITVAWILAILAIIGTCFNFISNFQKHSNKKQE